MKKIILIIAFTIATVTSFAQLKPSIVGKIQGATTAFGENLPQSSLIVNNANGDLYSIKSPSGIISTESISSSIANLYRYLKEDDLQDGTFDLDVNYIDAVSYALSGTTLNLTNLAHTNVNQTFSYNSTSQVLTLQNSSTYGGALLLRGGASAQVFSARSWYDVELFSVFASGSSNPSTIKFNALPTSTQSYVMYLDADGNAYKGAAPGGSSGAPVDASYLVTTANAELTNEIIVGATPGGVLGGTWANPTLDDNSVTVAKINGLSTSQQGGVIFSDGTNLGAEELYFYWDKTNNRLGINGNQPAANLDVIGDGVFSSTVTASNFILSSDRKYKKEINKLNNLKWADDIDFVSFRMRQDPSYLRYGVIAQDVEKINPQLIRKDEKGIYSVAYIDLLIAKVARQDEKIQELQSNKTIVKNETFIIIWLIVVTLFVVFWAIRTKHNNL